MKKVKTGIVNSGCVVFTLVIFLVLASSAAAAEIKKPAGYPTRPIEVSVAFGVGSGLDAMARVVVPLLEKRLGTSIPIVNRPGANSVVCMTYVKNQPADGYSIAAMTNDTLAALAGGTTQLRVDDFVYLARSTHDIEMFFVRSDDKRFKTWDEYAKYAKANPNKLIMAVAGEGGIEQTAATLLNNAAGLSIKYIPFDKPTERYAAFLGGHTDLLVEEPADMMAYMKEGKIHPIIQMIDKGPVGFENVPTSVSKGYDVTMGLWRGFCVKKGTPPEISQYLEALIKDCYKDPVFLEYKKKRGYIRPEFVETSTEFGKSAAVELEQIKKAVDLIRNAKNP